MNFSPFFDGENPELEDLFPRAGLAPGERAGLTGSTVFDGPGLPMVWRERGIFGAPADTPHCQFEHLHAAW
jgi:hypothetical protein